PEDWLREFRRYVVTSRINITPGVGGVAGRAEALGLAISCFAEPALTWYETRVKGRNWKCNNLSDNLGVVDLNTVRALAAGNNNNQIGGLNTAEEFCNKADTEIGRIDAGVATGADIIPIGTWEEDWSIAGGEPTNDIPVVPNTGGGFPAITITPNITLGQFLYLVRTAYTSVEHLKQMAVFDQLV
ncbi:14888_t:CDS:1, partial [Acaulospora morrowiae]